MLPELNDDFTQLQKKLLPIWSSVREDDTFGHTSLIVPSLSVDQDPEQKQDEDDKEDRVHERPPWMGAGGVALRPPPTVRPI